MFTVGYSNPIKHQFAGLASQAMVFEGVTADADVSRLVQKFTQTARERLAIGSEGEFPEIQAWWRAFAKMGLRPTQYRCAAEALLRRFRKERSLPTIHPLVDLCNALSVAFAIPIAIFDTTNVNGFIDVRHADGTEIYETFSGDIETTDAGEVIFAERAGHAHARCWSNRQSGRSVVRPETSSVLIVTEALHDGAAEDVARVRTALDQALSEVWPLGRIKEGPGT